MSLENNNVGMRLKYNKISFVCAQVKCCRIGLGTGYQQPILIFLLLFPSMCASDCLTEIGDARGIVNWLGSLRRATCVYVPTFYSIKWNFLSKLYYAASVSVYGGTWISLYIGKINAMYARCTREARNFLNWYKLNEMVIFL